MVFNETADLLEMLLFTTERILESGQTNRQRIASAYREARMPIETLDHGNGPARLRVEACLSRFNIYQGRDDVASVGWMLAAIEERVGERSIFGWRKFEEIVQVAVHELRLSEEAPPQ